MAVLKLFEYPHPVLKQKTEKVEKVDGEIKKLLDDMLETMYASNGCGLAAPQIGVSLRLVVLAVPFPESGAVLSQGEEMLLPHMPLVLCLE